MPSTQNVPSPFYTFPKNNRRLLVSRTFRIRRSNARQEGSERTLELEDRVFFRFSEPPSISTRTRLTILRRSQFRILQCNINGLCTSATRVKLDQLLDLANRHQAHIIAIQETKLKPTYNLKLREYCILRKDRLNKGGGGLMFLIRNSNFECVELPPFSDTELEVQANKVKWNNKCLNIYNAYQHPGNRGVSSDTLIPMFTDSSFILDDFNAKHPLWGSSVANNRGNELSNLLDDHAFCILNDGTPTYCSHTYDSRDALDVAFASPDIFPSCSWTVLDSVGSDHSPVLIEFSHTHKTPNKKNALFWSFKKANWGLYKSSLDNSLSGAGFSVILTANGGFSRIQY
ncbi:hypothetical protein TNCT_265461 [Trichonephila clavata]|uniref:Endonuclease/exonuclease/phosphatase domain-containing protein n=1 Tax=Trichonephila clavata TaxID=2740835 RepID=A0A8X6GWF0_TRICU|nr:hypothetical protein TNCT_265461 [Trichonephila clavata]